MAQRRIDFLSLMYKKSSDPGNSQTASRRSDHELRDTGRSKAVARHEGHMRRRGVRAASAGLRLDGPKAWRARARLTAGGRY
jgi:hypothetical protein